MGYQPRRLRTSRRKQMGRPLKASKTVNGVAILGAIGKASEPGEQLKMSAFVTGGSALDTNDIVQKGTHRFRCTTYDGTEICTLVAKAPGALVAGECCLEAADQQGNTYYVSRISANWIEIGALGTGSQVAVGDRVQWVRATAPALTIYTDTYPVGSVEQPGRFQMRTS